MTAFTARDAHTFACFDRENKPHFSRIFHGGGMGSYNGGGTIMKGGRFLSFDPADSGDRPMPRKKSVTNNAAKIAGSNLSQTKAAKKTTKKHASPKIKKPKDPRKLLEKGRKTLLNTIIDQMLINRPEFKLPDQMHPDLKTELEGFGNPVEWAIQQGDFEQVQKRKIELRTERELRQRARKRIEDEKSPVVVETKRAKTFRKPDSIASGSSPAGNVTVNSALVPTGASKSAAQDEKKKKTQSGKLRPAGSPDNRTHLIRLLVDRLIQRKASTITAVPTIDPILLTEIKAAGGVVPWLKLQPSYPSLFTVRSAALRPGPKQVKMTSKPAPITEDSKKLSEAQIIKRGQSRIVIHGKRRSSPDLDALIKRVGILPPPPVTPPHPKKKNLATRITKARKVWISAVDGPQKAAWDKLLTKHQHEYACFGKIYLGRPQEREKAQKPKVAPLSDAPISYILKQLEKNSDDTLDPKRIDWDST